jgi:signal transduction histidine kinase
MRPLRRRPDAGLLLVRSLCHELRPPMTMLASLVQAMGDQPSEDRREELGRLAAEHAAHVDAVLAQADATASGLAGPTQPNLPLHRVLPMVTSTAPAPHLSVSVSPAAGRCLVRPRAVRQILINLIGNATRHGPADGDVHLRARVRRRRLLLSVADDGGLTPELADALRSRTPPPTSRGLGMWVVRLLAEADRGTVRARPRRPRGLEVEVSLPLRRS